MLDNDGLRRANLCGRGGCVPESTRNLLSLSLGFALIAALGRHRSVLGLVLRGHPHRSVDRRTADVCVAQRDRHDPVTVRKRADRVGPDDLFRSRAVAVADPERLVALAEEPTLSVCVVVLDDGWNQVRFDVTRTGVT